MLAMLERNHMSHYKVDEVFFVIPYFFPHFKTIFRTSAKAVMICHCFGTHQSKGQLGNVLARENGRQAFCKQGENRIVLSVHGTPPTDVTCVHPVGSHNEK